MYSVLEQSMKDITDPDIDAQDVSAGHTGIVVESGRTSTGAGGLGGVRLGRRNIWGQNDTYAVEVYDWSLPGRYRADGAQVN